MKRLLICVLALALLAGCAPASVQEPEDGKLHIVATVFPAYDFARAAAGDLADVELLLPPGTESHSYEPTPADILKVQSCDLFLYLGGDSDQWVETILEAAEPTGRTLALIDCVETLEEEHVEGMQEEVGHHHDEDEDDHDHDHLGTVTSKHYSPVRQAVEKRMKFAVQSVDLLRIFLCVGPILLPIRTVQLRQHLPKLPGDGRGVGRGGPNMLIDLRHSP